MSSHIRSRAGFLLPMLLLVVSGGMVHAEGDLWLTDFEAAKKQAKSEEKDLFLEFTGSDWCQPCKVFSANVLTTETFLDNATKEFVLVELDFPRTKPQSEELRKQNMTLQAEYGIEGYPTVVLADSSGTAYGKFGYARESPEDFLAKMRTLRAGRQDRENLLKKAEAAEGLEKARLLDEALGHLEQSGMTAGHESIPEQIIALDPDNEAGLKAKYEARQAVGEVEMLFYQNEIDQALASVETILEQHDPQGETLQQVLFLKAWGLNTKEDKPGAIAVLEEAHKAAPDSENADNILRVMEMLKQE